MPSAVHHRLGTTALLIGALIASDAARASDVTIYRCVSPSNQITLQDHPCPKDAHQDVRQMIRPQDAPPRPQVVATATTPATEVRIARVRDPQPLYECTNAESGETYINHSGIPESRYVPFWTLGLADSFFSHPQHRPPSMHRLTERPPHARFAASPALVYVEDSCVRLPQDEACQRMLTRNNALGTLIFNGQPSDRERYEHERKILLEQMRDDCDAGY
jgi:hypothetical protein